LGDDLSERLDNELRAYVEMRASAEEAEAVAKRFKQAAEDQRNRLWEILEAAGIKTINHELGRITRTARVKAVITDDDALMEWLDSNGMVEAMTKRAFRQQNLNGLATDMIEEGESLPQGLDTITIRGITYTPSKK
jgi:aspartate/methionine/tyrosine aminotransferase